MEYRIECRMCGMKFDVHVVEEKTVIPIIPHVCVGCGSLKVDVIEEASSTIQQIIAQEELERMRIEEETSSQESR